MLMARSTFEGVKKLMNGKRPMNITRSGFAGMQRYTILWTGDNQATDHHMMLGVRLVNSLGLSGLSFTGSDVGGFGGNCTPALFARWMQLALLHRFSEAIPLIILSARSLGSLAKQLRRYRKTTYSSAIISFHIFIVQCTRLLSAEYL